MLMAALEISSIGQEAGRTQLSMHFNVNKITQLLNWIEIIAKHNYFSAP
jgi:hypothetical protein